MDSGPAIPDLHDQAASLTEPQRQGLDQINRQLYRAWHLGRNIIVGWCNRGECIEILPVPYYQLPDLLRLPGGDVRRGAGDEPENNGESIRMWLIQESRELAPEFLHGLAAEFGIETERIRLPEGGTAALGAGLIDGLLKRYSITWSGNRAVALFDIVGFSLFSPFHQTTLLHSLSYSINSAHNKLREQGIVARFARTSTGDGFYIWNRDGSIQGNINLYHLLHLVLADNAIARTKSHGSTAPELKSAFQVGSFYEFYPAESLHPTRYNYIVGDVTIELARMVEAAIPGQILVGDFRSRIPADDRAAGTSVEVDTISFIELLQERLGELEGLELAGEGIDAIRCYLTGTKKHALKSWTSTD